MKLGLLTAAFPDLTLEEVASWAGANGFETLEIACWPVSGGEKRRYAGVSHIDTERLDAAGAPAVLDAAGPARARDLVARVLPEPPAPRSRPPRRGQRASRPRRRRQPRCSGVEVVGTFVGADPARSLTENLRSFAEVWPALVDEARARGVKIAIENCPMLFSGDEWPFGTNLARTPHIWREMFNVIPDAGFGLNLDPSHLVWQMIDYERVVYDFADRILHVHAKDMEIDRAGLQEHGVLGAGLNWQVPRLPGLGEVALGSLLRGALRHRLRPLDLGRARGSRVRGRRRPRQARVPDRSRRAAHLRALSAAQPRVHRLRAQPPADRAAGGLGERRPGGEAPGAPSCQPAGSRHDLAHQFGEGRRGVARRSAAIHALVGHAGAENRARLDQRGRAAGARVPRRAQRAHAGSRPAAPRRRGRSASERAARPRHPTARAEVPVPEALRARAARRGRRARARDGRRAARARTRARARARTAPRPGGRRASPLLRPGRRRPRARAAARRAAARSRRAGRPLPAPPGGVRAARAGRGRRRG